jgi:gamma-glutamylaminecyclotransferase
VEKQRIFVYGTLRRGLWNHHWLMNSRYIGNGKTCNKYALYADTIPYVFKSESVSPIHGEVYDVDEKTLTHIDRLENHPAWYRRELVDICLEDETIIRAWLYFFPENNGSLIKTGDYLDWR